MNARTRQRGFALLMALVLVALAGVLMAAAVRRSSRAVLEANAAREDLQRRWGALTLESVLSSRIGQILDEAEAQSPEPLVSCRKTVTLGDMAFELIFCDEQAKANVNALYDRQGLRGLMAAAESLVSRANLAGMSVLLQPQAARTAEPTGMAPGGIENLFRCYGQIFADFDVAAWTLADQEQVLDRLTCWGDGRLNFRRCRPEVLEAVAAGILTVAQQDQLIALRKEIPGISLDEAMKRLELTDEHRRQAAAALTGNSACASMWTIARTDRRRWYRLLVQSPDATGQGASLRTFVW